MGAVENSVDDHTDDFKKVSPKAKDTNCSFSDICIYFREKFTEGNGLKRTIRHKRNIEILKRRYGIGCKPESLKKIGKTYGLSRERIRQLSTRSVRLIYDSLPNPQKEFIDNFLLRFREDNGLIPFEGDEDALHAEEFIYFNTIIKTLEKSIMFDWKVGVWRKRDSTGFMARIKQLLDDHFKEGESYSNIEIMNISEILVKKLDMPDRLFESLSKIIIAYRFKSLHGRFFYERVNLTSIYEQIIEQHFPSGIAILRDIDDLNSAVESEELKVKDKKEIRYLLARSNKLVLWDWGVYIHKSNIRIDKSILKDVNKWLSLRIRSGVQKVSLWGAFSQFQEECQKCGIPNEHALYSCMKMKYIGKYSFLKDPFVYPTDIERAINQNEIIENYLLKHTRGIRVEDIRYEFGLKDFQINGIIADSNKISYWGKREVIHIDNICVDDNDLHQICRWFDKELEKYKHISVIHAYQSNIVLCKKNGINNSKALYTVISNYYDKRCVLPRYPFVLSKDCMIEDDGYFSINDAVNHFFESRNRVVYYGELYDYFVKERGYSESSLRTIKYICDGIVEYTRKSFISLKTLNWTEEKAELLEKVAIEKSNKDHNAGQCFSLMSELIEEDLPIIDENIDIGWQRILLSELLEHSERMRILGSMQGVYVLLPNQDGIESEEDLVCHILRNEFDGAANKDKFIERLRKLEISGSLGKKTGGWDKLVVKNEEVFIRN